MENCYFDDDSSEFKECNNDKCTEIKSKCADDNKYILYEEINNNEFKCYDKCIENYGYKTDKKKEYICYKKDEEIDGYYWDGDNFSPCLKNCSKCVIMIIHV